MLGSVVEVPLKRRQMLMLWGPREFIPHGWEVIVSVYLAKADELGEVGP